MDGRRHLGTQSQELRGSGNAVSVAILGRDSREAIDYPANLKKREH